MPICSVCKVGYEESAEQRCPQCGANLATQKRRRRAGKVTGLMKIWCLPLVLGGVALTVLGQQVRAGLQPCNWLDMALERSGCVAKVTVDADDLGDPAIELTFSANAQALIFSPDGQTIAMPRRALLLKEDGRRARGKIIPVVSLDSGEILHTLRIDETALDNGAPMLPREDEDAVFSADGALLAASIRQNDSHVVYLWARETGERLWRTRMENCSELAFSEDGQFVLCEERRIAIADAAVTARVESDELSERVEGTEEPLVTLNAEGVFLTELFFSPDGEQLMVCGRDEDGDEAMYLWRRGNQMLERLRLRGDDCLAVVWSPDGARIGMVSPESSDTLLVFEVDEIPRL